MRESLFVYKHCVGQHLIKENIHFQANLHADLDTILFRWPSRWTSEMSGICSKCKTECVFKETKGEKFGFPCDVCRAVLCRECADLSATEIRFVTMATRAVPYLCGECIGALRRVPLLEKKIQELEHDVRELLEAAKTSKQSYADVLKASIDSTDEIKESLKDLEKKVVNSSKQEGADAAGGIQQLEPAVQELQERESRAASVLLFGIGESDAATREERIAQENKTVESILRKIDVSVTKEIRVRRLGRYDQQKVRPIKVTFPTKAEALNVLKRRRRLNSEEKIYIKGDQTVSQRNYLKAVIAELETRTSNGEKNLKIRYVNSVPKIVKTSTPVQKN